MLALFVVAIVVFILPFAFPTPPPIVTRFTSTALFSPNGDGARDIARMSVRLREPSEVTLEVQRDGSTVRRLLVDEPRPVGWVRVDWDGLDDDGRPVDDGVFALKLRVRSGQKRFNTTRRIVVDTRGPALAAVAARSVPAPARGQCLVTVEVLDDTQIRVEASPIAGGPVARTLGPRPVRPDRGLRWSWDGRDADGIRVLPGLYRIVVRARDVARNRAVTERSCWIGQLSGRSAPGRVAAGQPVGARLRDADGAPVPPQAGVRLSLRRRTGTPGADLSPPLGAPVGGQVTGRVGRARITIPEGERPERLWLVARSGGGEALIPLRS